MNINFEEENKKLLDEIEDNYNETSKLRSEISKFDLLSNSSDCLEESFNDSENDDSLYDEDNSNEFDDSIYEPFLSNYKKSSLDEVINILPDRDNIMFTRIILRLKAESLKSIKEFKTILASGVLEDSDLNDCFLSIRNELKKISFLDELLSEKEEVVSNNNQSNKLVLVTNSYGNIRVLDDLNNIPQELYFKFLVLLNSIIDGSFKGFKQFKRFREFSEVRYRECRIVFKQISKDTYAIITAFVKKTDRNSIYINWIENCYELFASFMKNYDSNDVDFIISNEEHVTTLIDTLSKKNKQLIKGVDYNE